MFVLSLGSELRSITTLAAPTSARAPRYADPEVRASFDSSRRPLIVVRPGRHVQLDTVVEFLALLEQELEREQPLCLMLDLRYSRRVELPSVRAFSEFGHSHAQQLAAHVRALAVVIPSAILRGSMRLAFQLNPPPHPAELCRTKPEALSWLEPHLAGI